MLRILYFAVLILPLHGEGALHFYSSAPLKVDKSQLRNLYLGRIFEVDKVAVRPIIIPEGASHKALLEKIVFKSASQYKRHWKKMLFTGKGRPPLEKDTEKGAYEFLLSKLEEKGIWILCSLRSTKPKGLFKVEVTP